MKYLLALLFSCLIFSCAEKKSNYSNKKETQETTGSLQNNKVELQTYSIEPVKYKVPNSIPEFAKRNVAALSRQYVIDTSNFILGDFNADNKQDFSTKIRHLKNGKHGVIIVHNSDKNEYYVFGAGKEVDGMDDLDWIDQFVVIPKGDTVAATLINSESGDIIGADNKNAVKIMGNGIYMHVDESEGGGIIYWNGRKYTWLHIE